MVWVPPGEFWMGSNEFPDAKPVHRVYVDGFWMDATAVTNNDFAAFVKATGYVTVAERDLDPAPGSLVFHPTRGPVPLDDFRQWWAYVDGACWHRPEGPGSETYSRARHPVVHVTPEDAEAYAAWAGASLATEVEWEYAAAGSHEHVNRWFGDFPWRGYRGTTPVGSFPANDHGLLDMVGNVWEWTADPFTAAATACCKAPGGCRPPDPPLKGHVQRRVIKGGSHLCAPNYCHRYRPAARQGEAIDTSTSHIGFRCVVRA
jgi:formylglycine-generating enzyme required for sulfatase activity